MRRQLQPQKKGMLYSMLVLFSTIAIFVATIAIMTTYSEQKAIEKADQHNDKQLRNIINALDRSLQNDRHLAFTFLSGFYNVSLGNSKDWEDATFTISDKVLRTIKLEDCYIGLEDFLRINPDAVSVIFIIEPDIVKAGGREKFTPCVMRDDSTHYDISDTNDFVLSPHYQYVKRTHKPIWFFTSKTYNGEKLFTQMIPVMRENGQLLCTFLVDYPFNFVQDILSTLVPFYDKSAISIIDSKYHVMASTNDYLAKLDRPIHINPQDGSWNTLSQRIAQKEPGHFLFEWDNKTYYSYHAPIPYTNFTAIVFAQKDAIYESAYKTRNRLFMIAGGGCILLFLCCLIIYRILRKNISRQAAMESELHTAATLQMGLLKNAASGQISTEQFTHSSIQTYIMPARDTGGDLYDYAEHNGHLLFMIGDVSGKGLSAAMFMTQVISLFRNAIRETTSPAAIVRRINNVLAHNNKTMTFCTMFVADYNPTLQTLTFCNAGHNLPILWSRTTAPHYLSVKPHAAACIFEDFHYTNESLTFTSDTHLLVYTDGISEAKNPRHENFGTQRLLSSIHNGHDVMKDILNNIETFVQNEQQSDDITMLLLSPTANDR